MNRFELAIDNIHSKGWTQHALHNDEGMCILGAMELPLKRHGVLQDTEETAKFGQYLRANCLNCQRAEELNGHLPDQHIIWRHNDFHIKSMEDAILLLKEVAHD